MFLTFAAWLPRSQERWGQIVVDVLSRADRSLLMGRVRARDTRPERTVRCALHALGFRFRLHRRDLPGTPDIVLPRFSTVILVHGCFWHRHPGCQKATTPSTRTKFWAAKFQSNVARDRSVHRKLTRLGWSVITIWECQTRHQAELANLLSKNLNQRRERDTTAVDNTSEAKESARLQGQSTSRNLRCRGGLRAGDRK
jgi:DNA mismatch endonuclease, patch repair protein